MDIIKILRNVSGVTRNVLNRELLNGESYLVPYSQWTKLADHQPTLDDITAGYVIVNNGSIDVSPTDAFKLIKRFDIQDADVTPFDNSTNGFTSTNVQDAIEELTVGVGVSTQYLREVTMVQYPFGPVNIESNLLFEPGPVNDTVLFLKEEII